MLSCLLASLGLIWFPLSPSRIRGMVGPRANPAAIGVASTGRRFRPFGRGWAQTVAGPGIAACGLGWLLDGPLAGISLGAVTATLIGLVRSEVEATRAREDREQLLAAVRLLARELRAGAAPTTAVRAVAEHSRGVGAEAMFWVAALMGSSAQSGLERPDRPDPNREPGAQAQVMARLAGGWSLSSRFGVPWAALIDALAVDLGEQARAGVAKQAQVAGPRMSGYLLAVMPLLGVLLGFGMGADPVGVLLGTGAGRLMLVVGSLLTCAGLIWSARIVRG